MTFNLAMATRSAVIPEDRAGSVNEVVVSSYLYDAFTTQPNLNCGMIFNILINRYIHTYISMCAHTSAHIVYRLPPTRPQIGIEFQNNVWFAALPVSSVLLPKGMLHATRHLCCMHPLLYFIAFYVVNMWQLVSAWLVRA